LTKAAEYTLSDKAYANLVANLSKRNFDRMTPELRENLLEYYSDFSLPIETRKDPARWQTLLTELDQGWRDPTLRKRREGWGTRRLWAEHGWATRQRLECCRFVHFSTLET
jgi:hypothetical protein